MPWNHFGRKNLGFVYAALHGAEYIYDTDDDNFVLDGDARFLPRSLTPPAPDGPEGVQVGGWGRLAPVVEGCGTPAHYDSPDAGAGVHPTPTVPPVLRMDSILDTRSDAHDAPVPGVGPDLTGTAHNVMIGDMLYGGVHMRSEMLERG